MNKSIKRGVAIALLLFTFTVPATTFAMTNEGQIESQNESIYEPQKEEFEKMLKDDVFTPSKEEIPYQDVPRIPGNTSEASKPSNNPPKKTPLVKGGNTKAVNNLATQENKARGSVIENVDRNGKDITPSGDTEKDKENPVDVRQFLTFQTKSGKTMHLIVDHSSNQDNVRLLTEVGEQDLLNMIESEDKNTIKVEEPKKEEVKKEEPKTVPVKEEKKSGIGSFLIVALVIGGVIGAGYYFKVVKAKENRMLEDFEEDDEDYISESEDESDNEESHEESSEDDEDDELL
ncbi:CD1107 family mobile element protein [Streptococcus dysgalactiae]|uniref:CD1107 family mobile element protein n=1 Tax=Streptococcus dysgalactiae TaxID=1334 RepID=UPI003FD6F20D